MSAMLKINISTDLDQCKTEKDIEKIIEKFH